MGKLDKKISAGSKRYRYGKVRW